MYHLSEDLSVHGKSFKTPLLFLNIYSKGGKKMLKYKKKAHREMGFFFRETLKLKNPFLTPNTHTYIPYSKNHAKKRVFCIFFISHT